MKKKHKEIALSIICFVFVCSLFAYLYQTAEGWYWWAVDDWADCLRHAARNLANPYSATKCPVPYPIWFFVVIYPLAILPAHLGHGILTAASILVLCLYVKDWYRALLLVLSTPVLTGLMIGQPDALLVIAFMVPIWGSVLIVSVKPVAMFGWVARKWISSGLRHRVIAACFVLCLLCLSALVWGPWASDIVVDGWNPEYFLTLSWPAMIPIGLLLLFTDDERLWLIGSLFLTPYLMRHHLVPLLAYFYKREKWWVLVIMTIVTWAWSGYGGF